MPRRRNIGKHAPDIDSERRLQRAQKRMLRAQEQAAVALAERDEITLHLFDDRFYTHRALAQLLSVNGTRLSEDAVGKGIDRARTTLGRPRRPDDYVPHVLEQPERFAEHQAERQEASERHPSRMRGRREVPA